MKPRDAALQALGECRKGQGRLDDSLRGLCAALSRRDAALARKLCYGVIQKQGLLDLGLRPFVRLESLEPPLPDILRLGAYQCWFLERIPRHAIVNESVNQVKKVLPRAAGLCNAVLRRLPDKAPESRDPCLRHNIQPWFYARLLDLLGSAEADAFLEASDSPAPLTHHQNPLRQAPLPEGAVAHPEIPGCYQAPFLCTEEIAAGQALVADAGAALCVLAAEPKPGERVWDCCAAPGGKSILMSLAMEGRGTLLATELEGAKLPLVREAAARFGLRNIRTACADASVYIPDGLYDLVLCDVPCSGFGVLRRKPDIRFRSEEDCAALPPRQLAILRNAARYVKPGGRLCYCTCTVFKEENEDVTAAFLRENPDFALEAFSLPAAGACGGEIRLYPHRHGTDGFYICKLRRRQEA